jgi:hypothetical protein
MKEVQGYYGSQNTACTIFVYKGWYCVEGSKNVNYTNDKIELGLNVEELNDSDSFTWSEEINSLDELIEAVDN